MKLRNIKKGYVKEVDDNVVSQYLATKEWEIAYSKPKSVEKTEDKKKEGK